MSVNFAPLQEFLRKELAPYEGRLGMTWRTAAICALVAMVFMVYGIPLAPIACYLVLFIVKPNITESLLMGIGIIILVGIIIPILVGLAIISVDNVVVRMLVLSLGSFIFMYLSVASKVGEVGSIVALVIGFIMTLVGMAPFGELVTRAILYAALMAVAPMGVMLAFLILLGPSPASLAQRHLLRRTQAMAAVVRGDLPASTLLPFLREGNDALDKMLLFSTLFHQRPKAQLQQLKQLAQSLYMLMAAWTALPEDTPISDNLRQQWAQRCKAVEEALKAGTLIPMEAAAASADVIPCATLQDIAQRVHQLPALPSYALTESPLPKSSFLNDDVAHNRSYAEFGIKVTFSAVISYLIYTALQWQDIHTAMITCYVAALGTVGETIHKLILRIAGCLVGAAMGIASILFLMPHMSNIGQLMALVFAGCMVAAWVAQGSERISYAGVQIGLAFVLTVLQGFGPDVKISVALDRIYGILLGNFILFVVFTQIWPVSSASRVLQMLRKHVTGFAALMHNKPQAALHMQAALPELLPQLQTLREQIISSKYEAAVLHIPVSEQQQMQHSINELETVYLQTAFGELSLQAPEVQNKVQALQSKVMAGGIA